MGPALSVGVGTAVPPPVGGAGEVDDAAAERRRLVERVVDQCSRWTTEDVRSALMRWRALKRDSKVATAAHAALSPVASLDGGGSFSGSAGDLSAGDPLSPPSSSGASTFSTVSPPQLSISGGSDKGTKDGRKKKGSWKRGLQIAVDTSVDGEEPPGTDPSGAAARPANTEKRRARRKRARTRSGARKEAAALPLSPVSNSSAGRSATRSVASGAASSATNSPLATPSHPSTARRGRGGFFTQSVALLADSSSSSDDSEDEQPAASPLPEDDPDNALAYVDNSATRNRTRRALARMGPSWISRRQWFSVFTPVGSSAPSLLDAFPLFAAPLDFEEAASTKGIGVSRIFADGSTDSSKGKRAARRGLRRHESSMEVVTPSGGNRGTAGPGGDTATATTTTAKPMTQCADVREALMLVLIFCGGRIHDRAGVLVDLWDTSGATMHGGGRWNRAAFAAMMRSLLRLMYDIGELEHQPSERDVRAVADEQWFSADTNVDHVLSQDEVSAWAIVQLRTGGVLNSARNCAIGSDSLTGKLRELHNKKLAEKEHSANAKTSSTRTSRRASEASSHRRRRGPSVSSDAVEGSGSLRRVVEYNAGKLVKALSRGRSIPMITSETAFKASEVSLLAAEFVRANGGAGSAAMDENAFRRVLERFLPNCVPVSHVLYKFFDDDGNELLSFREFAIAFSQLFRGTIPQRLELLHAVADANKSGKVTMVELVALVAPTDPILNGIIAFADKVFDTLEQDGDEGIDSTEFVQGVAEDVDLSNLFTQVSSVSLDATRALLRVKKRSRSFDLPHLLDLVSSLKGKARDLVAPLTLRNFLDFMAESFDTDIEDETTSNALQFLFSELDFSRSGRVVTREVLVLFSQFLAIRPTDKMSALFCLMDLDGNGRLDRNELVYALLAMKQHSEQRAAEFMEMVSLLDGDGDGVISREELMESGGRCKLIMDCVTRLFMHSRELNTPGRNPRLAGARAMRKARAVARFRAGVGALSDDTSESEYDSSEAGSDSAGSAPDSDEKPGTPAHLRPYSSSLWTERSDTPDETPPQSVVEATSSDSEGEDHALEAARLLHRRVSERSLLQTSRVKLHGSKVVPVAAPAGKPKPTVDLTRPSLGPLPTPSRVKEDSSPDPIDYLPKGPVRGTSQRSFLSTLSGPSPTASMKTSLSPDSEVDQAYSPKSPRNLLRRADEYGRKTLSKMSSNRSLPATVTSSLRSSASPAPSPRLASIGRSASERSPHSPSSFPAPPGGLLRSSGSRSKLVERVTTALYPSKSPAQARSAESVGAEASDGSTNGSSETEKPLARIPSRRNMGLQVHDTSPAMSPRRPTNRVRSFQMLRPGQRIVEQLEGASPPKKSPRRKRIVPFIGSGPFLAPR